MMASLVSIVGSGFSYGGLALKPSRAGGGEGQQRPSVAVVVRAEAGNGAINPAIRKTEEKVVDVVPLSELAKPQTAYCRCWRSATFPLCDGSHVKHNKATGDNVGPLLLKKEKQ